MVLDKVHRRYVGLIVFVSCFSCAFSQDHQLLTKKESKFVKRVFSEEWIAEALILPDQNTAFSGLLLEEDRVHIIRQQDLVLGYLLSTRAMGRFDPFDYLLAFAPDFSVLDLSITVYRSAHGAAICQKKWLSQFEAYAGEDLTYGKDIDAISGATISATSMVKDVQRCYQIMISLKEEALIQ